MSTIANAHKLIMNNRLDEASSIFRALVKSSDHKVKLDAILGLHSTLNDMEHMGELKRLTDEGILVAQTSKKWDAFAFLCNKKAKLFEIENGFLSYRQANLTLADGVFKWLDFATEAEKFEYDLIVKRRIYLNQEISTLEQSALKISDATDDHYLRGHIFLQQSELSESKYLHARIDLMQKGRWTNKIARFLPMHSSIQLFLLYKKQDRRKLHFLMNQGVEFAKKALTEFQAMGSKLYEAYAHYNLATKYFTLFQFRKALVALCDAEKIGKEIVDIRLLEKIADLQKTAINHGKDRTNYVEEYGLDLPNNLGESLLNRE